jgi:hypothetical protein
VGWCRNSTQYFSGLDRGTWSATRPIPRAVAKARQLAQHGLGGHEARSEARAHLAEVRLGTCVAERLVERKQRLAQFEGGPQQQPFKIALVCSGEDRGPRRLRACEHLWIHNANACPQFVRVDSTRVIDLCKYFRLARHELASQRTQRSRVLVGERTREVVANRLASQPEHAVDQAEQPPRQRVANPERESRSAALAALPLSRRVSSRAPQPYKGFSRFQRLYAQK